jgi:hypothetical protein
LNNPLRQDTDMTRIHLPSILAAVAATAAGLMVITLAAPSHAQGQAFGRGALRGDGSGNAHGAAGSGFSTDAGGQGLRTRSFNRGSDGSISAQSQGHVTTANGASASSQNSFTRNADGTAAGERNATVTGANGTTFDGSTTYTKGSGFSRSASCRDAAGNTVSCAPR